MAVKGLTLLLVAFTFYNNAVMGATDCTLPWLAKSSPFFKAVDSEIINRCPPIIGDQNKSYCCYNPQGEVECCEFQEFLVFGLILLIPILIVMLILSCILSCICCLCCPCCAVYKRRQGGRVLVQPPLPSHFVLINGIPVVTPSEQFSYYASASNDSTRLVSNEFH